MMVSEASALARKLRSAFSIDESEDNLDHFLALIPMDYELALCVIFRIIQTAMARPGAEQTARSCSGPGLREWSRITSFKRLVANKSKELAS